MVPLLQEALEFGKGAAGFVSGSTTAIEGVRKLLRKPDPDLTEIKSLAAQAIDNLMEAKAAQMAMQDKILELENELKNRDRFAQQAPRYTLTKTDLGGLVYSLKPDQAQGEPAHDLCAACFDSEIKSVLQPVDFNTLECPRCKSRVFKGDGRSGAMISSSGSWSRGF